MILWPSLSAFYSEINLLCQWVQGYFPLSLLSGSLCLVLYWSLWSTWTWILYSVISMGLFAIFYKQASLAGMTKNNDKSVSACSWRCGARETSIDDGRVNLYSHFRNQYGSFSENQESIYPAVPLLGIYPKDALFHHKDTCSTMLILTLFILATDRKCHRHSSIKK